MKIITFIREGQKVPAMPVRPGLETRIVNFDCEKLDELLLIAKFKILTFPTSIIIDDRNRVLLRVRGGVLNIYVDRLSI